MMPHEQPDTAALARVIEEVTVDCYNDDEALTAFCVAIEECLDDGQVAARLAGFDTTLTGLDYAGDRRGLVARVHHHGGRAHAAALFDLELRRDADPELVELLAAYREWCRR